MTASGHQALEKVTVELRIPKEDIGPVIKTQTDQDGRYIFRGIAAGWWIVRTITPTNTEMTCE